MADTVQKEMNYMTITREDEVFRLYEDETDTFRSVSDYRSLSVTRESTENFDPKPANLVCGIGQRIAAWLKLLGP